jgi:pimeloyl-ACP methyl ester carboxylesterase
VADHGVARGTSRFLSAMDKRELLDVSTGLSGFGKPVLLLWGTADPFFKISLAERLRDVLPDARLVRVEGARAFVPLDEPDRVAEEIVAFAGAPTR